MLKSEPNNVSARVVHLSTAHVANDVRIFFRESCSLAADGFIVFVIAREAAVASASGITSFSIKTFKSRLGRVVGGQLQALKHLRRLKFDILHFHDPELILVGLFFALLGKSVIFDIHENIREGLWDKRWIPFKKIVIPAFLELESWALRRFYVVLAESSYERLYPDVPAGRRRTIRNFPDYKFFQRYQNVGRGTGLRLFYVGGVTRERGALVILRAIRRLRQSGREVTFDCVGPIESSLAVDSEFISLTHELRENVRYHGRLALDKAYALAKNATIGLCILQPIKNYLGSYPTKVFEYMAIGMPFVISDFDLYREVLGTHGCGVFVDPTSDEALAEALTGLGTDAERLKQLTEAGIAAVESTYSWEPEARRLSAFYREILNAGGT